MISPPNFAAYLSKRFASRMAFTLIELITVIAIIAILMGLLLPAVTTVRNQANKAKAKSDVLNIVTAVKGFYTDYGQYPAPAVSGTTDIVIGPGNTNLNYMLMDVLRATSSGGSSWNGATNANTDNPRQIVYLDAPNVKLATSPKGGIATSAATVNSTNINVGDFVDPWGMPYFVAIDYNYDNVINASILPWTSDVTTNVRAGVVAYSYGIDGQKGKAGGSTLNGSDDIVSFQ